MIDIDTEHVLELSPADDQDPVEAVAPDRADPPLGERVRLRCPTLSDPLETELKRQICRGLIKLTKARATIRAQLANG